MLGYVLFDALIVKKAETIHLSEQFYRINAG